MSFELEPLDPVVDDLLREERAACQHDAAPEAAKARVLRRLDLGIAGLALPVATASPTPSGPSPGHAAGHAAAAGHAVAAPLARRVVAIVASFVVGGSAGAGAMHWHDTRTAAAPSTSAPVVLAPVPPPVIVREEPPAVAVSSLPLVSSAPVAITAVTAPPSAPAPASSAEDLAAERILLDEARTALMQGESERAIAPLQKHARRFPRGRLSEEREALLVQALARSGQAAEAQERGARFQQKFPGSLFTTAVDDALGAISDK